MDFDSPCTVVSTPILWPTGAEEIKTAVDFIDVSLLQGKTSVTTVSWITADPRRGSLIRVKMQAVV